MEQAYEIAALAVKARLEQYKPDFARILEKIKPGMVSVQKGVHDHVHNIVKNLKVPFDQNTAQMHSAKIIFINCGMNIDSHAAKLRNTVENGATLVTSDWALTGIVEPTFPNTIGRNPKSSGDEVVSVEPVSGSLWSDVVVPGADPQWWLESSSYPIKIKDEKLVRVEAASHDMLVRLDSPEVAVSFDWGKGLVFHVVSHFWCKRSHAPNAIHSTSAENFLKLGMKLSDDSIEKIKKAKPNLNKLKFAEIQTAATSTELVAQLIARTIIKE